MTYDAFTLANRGRDAAQSYGRFIKAQERMLQDIRTALDEGMKPIKITHDLLGRCKREQQLDLMVLLLALAQQEKIPEEMVEPFNKGIVPKRV